jgi:hypothetical protein
MGRAPHFEVRLRRRQNNAPLIWVPFACFCGYLPHLLGTRETWRVGERSEKSIMIKKLVLALMGAGLLAGCSGSNDNGTGGTGTSSDNSGSASGSSSSYSSGSQGSSGASSSASQPSGISASGSTNLASTSNSSSSGSSQTGATKP